MNSLIFMNNLFVAMAIWVLFFLVKTIVVQGNFPAKTLTLSDVNVGGVLYARGVNHGDVLLNYWYTACNMGADCVLSFKESSLRFCLVPLQERSSIFLKLGMKAILRRVIFLSTKLANNINLFIGFLEYELFPDHKKLFKILILFR